MIGAVLAKKKAGLAYDALNRRDIASFMADCAEDATYTVPGNVPISGEAKGKKAIETVVTRIMEQFPKMNFTVKEVFVSNIFAMGATNNVAVEWEVAQTNRAGKQFHKSAVTIIRAKGGKIVSARDYYFDPEDMKEAWGEG
jgi:ketosteroid isomerase-like protein